MRLPNVHKDQNSTNFDISISDLMSALVLIFILLLATQMLEIKKQSSLAQQYRDRQKQLYTKLRNTFEGNLEGWNAEIDEKTLVIRFRNEDKNGNQIGFDPESAILKNRFKAILDDFFPRYINVLMQPDFIGDIDEIRIEGHTANPDSKYSTAIGYSDSIWLSQERANNVLFHVLQGPSLVDPQRSSDSIEWIRTHIAASGFAYAKPIMIDPESIIPDWKESRRVEFKIRTKYEEVIQKIIEVGMED
jgi:outer membrane protein OmpA-like peptidoglycan-associated protein